MASRDVWRTQPLRSVCVCAQLSSFFFFLQKVIGRDNDVVPLLYILLTYSFVGYFLFGVCVCITVHRPGSCGLWAFGILEETAASTEATQYTTRFATWIQLKKCYRGERVDFPFVRSSPHFWDADELFFSFELGSRVVAFVFNLLQMYIYNRRPLDEIGKCQKEETSSYTQHTNDLTNCSHSPGFSHRCIQHWHQKKTVFFFS